MVVNLHFIATKTTKRVQGSKVQRFKVQISEVRASEIQGNDNPDG
jgi:hypothetical protein